MQMIIDVTRTPGPYISCRCLCEDRHFPSRHSHLKCQQSSNVVTCIPSSALALHGRSTRFISSSRQEIAPTLPNCPIVMLGILVVFKGNSSPIHSDVHEIK